MHTEYIAHDAVLFDKCKEFKQVMKHSPNETAMPINRVYIYIRELEYFSIYFHLSIYVCWLLYLDIKIVLFVSGYAPSDLKAWTDE